MKMFVQQQNFVLPASTLEEQKNEYFSPKLEETWRICSPE